MTPRRVRFTTTGQEHVRREKAWWLENRTRAEIFATDLEEALKILAVLPGAGTSYRTTCAGEPPDGIKRRPSEAA